MGFFNALGGFGRNVAQGLSGAFGQNQPAMQGVGRAAMPQVNMADHFNSPEIAQATSRYSLANDPNGFAPGAGQQGRPPGFWWDIAGQLSDAISESRGAPASYAPIQAAREQRQQEAEMRNALGQWLNNPQDQTAFHRMVMIDPERALGLRKGMMEPQADLPVRAQELAAAGLRPGTPEFNEAMMGRIAAQDRDVVVIDGIAYDPITGEPLFESPYSRIIPGQEGSFFEQPRIGLGRQASNPAPSQPPASRERTVQRSGTAPDGRKVIQYTDGTIEYAD